MDRFVVHACQAVLFIITFINSHRTCTVCGVREGLRWLRTGSGHSG